MGTFNYAKSRATAERLLKKFGQTGAIRREDEDNNNPGEPDDGTVAFTDHACTLVVLAYTNREIDGSLIQSTDRKVLVSTSGLTIEPQTSDLIVIASELNKIKNVKPLSPAGTVVMWEVQARR